MTDTIQVTMTETVIYVHTYTVEQLAEMLGCEPTVEGVMACRDEVALDDSGLLDSIMEHFDSVPDRDWMFDAEERDPTPCCADPGCPGNPCTFPGYAANH